MKITYYFFKFIYYAIDSKIIDLKERRDRYTVQYPNGFKM